MTVTRLYTLIVDSLTALNFSVSNLIAGVISATSLSTPTAVITDLESVNVVCTNLQAGTSSLGAASATSLQSETSNLGAVTAASINAGAGTIQTTGSVVAGSAAVTSLLASSLNSATSVIGATTATSLNLLGNFTWSNYNAIQRVGSSTVGNATPISMFAGTTQIYGGGSVSAAPQTFSTASLQAGEYEISLTFLAIHSSTQGVMRWYFDVDGVQMVANSVPRLTSSNAWESITFKRIVTLSAGVHTFLPTFAQIGLGGTASTQEITLTVHRVSISS